MRAAAIALSLVVATSGAFAQKGFQVGAKVIPTWSWFLNEDDEGLATSSMCYGFDLNYHWNDGLGVGIDVVLGTEEQVIDHNGSDLVTARHLIKLPLLLHFNSPAEDVVPFLGYVGIEYTKVRSVFFETAFPTWYGASELYERTNFGVVLGFGPGWNIIDKLQFAVILRAEYLINDPEDKDSDVGALFWGDRSRTTLGTLGFDLGLKYILR